MVRHKLIIRDVCESDLSSLKFLLSQLRGYVPWEEDQEGKAQQILSDAILNPLRSILIAESEGEPVGTADLTIVENLTRGLKPWGVIENIVVDKHCRSAGIGRELLEAATSVAANHGCYKVELISAAHRVIAHKLYEQAGFDAEVRGYRKYLLDLKYGPSSESHSYISGRA